MVNCLRHSSAEVEIRFLICQDKMSRQFEFWLNISRIWLDKFSGLKKAMWSKL